MAIKPYQGTWKTRWYPKKASTAFNKWGLVYPDGSGAVQPADSTSGEHLGIGLKTVASTDSDYALNTFIPVAVPVGMDATAIADVGTGTLTTAMVGLYRDLKDDNEIDVSATSKNVVFIEKFISSSKAVIKINALASPRYVATT